MPAIPAGSVRGGKPVSVTDAGVRAAIGGSSCPGTASAARPCRDSSRAVLAISGGSVRGVEPVSAVDVGVGVVVGGSSRSGTASVLPANCAVCHVEYSLARCECQASYCSVDWGYHRQRCDWVRDRYASFPAPPLVPSLLSKERRALRRFIEREGKSSGALSDISGPSTDAASATPSRSTTVGRGAGRQKKNTHFSKW